MENRRVFCSVATLFLLLLPRASNKACFKIPGKKTSYKFDSIHSVVWGNNLNFYDCQDTTILTTVRCYKFGLQWGDMFRPTQGHPQANTERKRNNKVSDYLTFGNHASYM
jgi:hypothetical protein